MLRSTLSMVVLLQAVLLAVPTLVQAGDDHQAALACAGEAAEHHIHAAATAGMAMLAERTVINPTVEQHWLSLARTGDGAAWHERCLERTVPPEIISRVCRDQAHYNAWCAEMGSTHSTSPIDANRATRVMFEARDHICHALAEEYVELQAIAERHRPGVQGVADQAMQQAVEILKRAAQAEPALLTALYADFATAMAQYAQASYEAQFGSGGDAFRLQQLMHESNWDTCRRHAPHSAIPKWRHLDELTWCRDEYDTYAPIRERLAEESKWLIREYHAISNGDVSNSRIEAYNSRSAAYRALDERYGEAIATYDARCTGYRAAPRFAVAVCAERSDGFCSR